MLPWSLFNWENSIPINQLADVVSWPTTWSGKVVQCTLPFVMSKQHYNWWEVGHLLAMTFNPPLKVLVPIYGPIYKLLCGESSSKKQYEVTIGNFPAYTCMDFVIMISSSLRKWEMGHVNTYTMYCNMSCFVGILKFHSFLDLELRWSLSFVGSFSSFHIGRSNYQKS